MLAFLWRDRRLHDFIARGFRVVFPISKAKRAIAELEAAAAHPHQPGDSDYSAANIVRGDSVANWMEKDVGAKCIEKSLVLNMPLQSYVDLSFKSGKAVGALAHMTSTIASTASEETKEFRKAKKEALDLNLKIASGDAGLEAVEAMCVCLFEFTCPDWARLQLTPQDQHDTCDGLVRMVAESWRRLWFLFQTPQMETLCWAKYEDYQVDLVQTMAQDMLSRKRKCKHCVCEFSEAWATRVTDPDGNVAKQALRCIGDMTPSIPFNSQRVEQRHLLAQEAAVRKRRGRCPRPAKVGKNHVHQGCC